MSNTAYVLTSTKGVNDFFCNFCIIHLAKISLLNIFCFLKVFSNFRWFYYITFIKYVKRLSHFVSILSKNIVKT
ncbi:hypothetical protein NJAUSS_1677 [Streptococcus suis SC070731]|nr:hypothetical protein NJAUSS_1677 [Streptococcus suis SC070731]